MNTTAVPIAATATNASSSFETMAAELNAAADRIEDAARIAIDEIESQAAKIADVAAALHERVVAEDLATLRAAETPVPKPAA
jgi:hypothetical protein